MWEVFKLTSGVRGVRTQFKFQGAEGAIIGSVSYLIEHCPTRQEIARIIKCADREPLRGASRRKCFCSRESRALSFKR
jgi:hypothetical protein